jgi:hypothetical protein
MIEPVNGDLLASGADVIVQQCNCITRKSLGLSALIASQLAVDPYSARRGSSANLADEESSAKPGQVSLHAAKDCHVACLYAQYAPGSSRKTYPFYERVKAARGITETAAQRELWFSESLKELTLQLADLPVETVAFPHGIGCGLAGGNWLNYLGMIERWAASVPYRVQIYKL